MFGFGVCLICFVLCDGLVNCVFGLCCFGVLLCSASASVCDCVLSLLL